MNRFSIVCVLFVLCVAAGCQEPPPVIYGPDNPGAWKIVMPDAPKVTFAGPKVTVDVDYESRMGDYVNRVYLTDDQGERVGELAFPPGADPKVTFTLPAGTKTITVSVLSSKRGRWQGSAIPVPKK
jgi:hypothetical protein